jgi:ankyrin repeat protein
MLALAGGQDMNARDVMGRTPLHWAVTSGKEELLELLVGNGARLDVADDSGYTPLHLAAASGQLVMARLLLNRRADPLVSTRGGQMALALASDPQMKHLLQTHPAVLDAQQRSAARVAEAQVSGGGGSQQQGRRVAQRGASEESSGSENTFQRFLSFFK